MSDSTPVGIDAISLPVQFIPLVHEYLNGISVDDLEEGMILSEDFNSGKKHFGDGLTKRQITFIKKQKLNLWMSRKQLVLLNIYF